MTPFHPIDTTQPSTDSSRWEQVFVASTFERFKDPDCSSSQRQYAQEHGIPRSTFGYWLRQSNPEGVEPDLVSFFRSSVGLRFLRRLVLALFVAFLFRGACGLRLLSLFLQLTQLDRFVASSTGALHQLSLTIETDIGKFAEEERPRLAEGMKHRHIALVPDENFHGPQICLVAVEPASNFIFVEQYADRRDEATWTAAITVNIAGLPVTVLLLSSDRAKALIACAHNGMQTHHLPEVFHGQRELCQPVMGPLERHKKCARKELEKTQEQREACRLEAEKACGQTAGLGLPPDLAAQVAATEKRVEEADGELKRWESLKEEALQAVRGLADDFHPFDRQSGAKVEEAEIQKRLGQRMQSLEQVVEQGQLPGKAREAVVRGKNWIAELVGAMGWFWGVTRILVEELDLPEEAEQAVYEKLLPGLYWQQAARRGRTAEEQHDKADLAQRLLEQAWAAGGALSLLAEVEQEELKRVAQEIVGLFARSSSCVEGRNGRLSLFHHGQTRHSAGRLKALTVIHNYQSTRPDGTTAAERFFGKKPRDLFDWLLGRLPNLPQPAAKRPNKATQNPTKPA